VASTVITMFSLSFAKLGVQLNNCALAIAKKPKEKIKATINFFITPSPVIKIKFSKQDG
jgi:hypothetical protein